MVGMSNRIHVREFNNYLGDLHRSLPAWVKKSDVVKGEAEAILVMASKKTERANISDLTKRYTIKRSTKKSRKSGPIQQDPNLVPFVTMRGKKYSTKNYYPEPVWKEMKKKLEFYKKRAKSRVYSAKATWFLMAQKARLSTKKFKSRDKLIGAIRNQAASFKKNSTENGQQLRSLNRFRIKIFNNSVAALNKSARGHFAIKSAMGGREKFYKTNMLMGVFKKAQRSAKKYPGVMVSMRR